MVTFVVLVLLAVALPVTFEIIQKGRDNVLVRAATQVADLPSVLQIRERMHYVIGGRRRRAFAFLEGIVALLSFVVVLVIVGALIRFVFWLFLIFFAN